MITKSVELPATAASARREREGKPQAAQQENTKQGVGYGNVIPRGCDIKGTGGERPSLGQQQRSRSRCKVRKVHLVPALVASMGSESLPALERPTVAGYCGVVGTGCGVRRPLRGVKARVTQVFAARGSQQWHKARRPRRAACGGGALQRRARGPGRQGGCRTKTPSELLLRRQLSSAGAVCAAGS